MVAKEASLGVIVVLVVEVESSSFSVVVIFVPKGVGRLRTVFLWLLRMKEATFGGFVCG